MLDGEISGNSISLSKSEWEQGALVDSRVWLQLKAWGNGGRKLRPGQAFCRGNSHLTTWMYNWSRDRSELLVFRLASTLEEKGTLSWTQGSTRRQSNTRTTRMDWVRQPSVQILALPLTSCVTWWGKTQPLKRLSASFFDWWSRASVRVRWDVEHSA